MQSTGQTSTQARSFTPMQASVDCIYEGEDQLYIHPDECIDCGACEPECPVSAIYPEEDVPANLAAFIAKNRDAFESDDPPGRPRK